jgi:polyhydroxybutyrate depolymerase
LRVGGHERRYLVYTPAGLSPGAALVIVLHASEMNGRRMRQLTGYEFERLADKHGFAVVYPYGYRHNWNDCRRHAAFAAKRENIDDVGFIRSLIARCVADHGVDPARVYAFGYSNGGHMAFRLAIEARDAITAIAAVAANLPAPDSSSCPQHGATARVMLVNGTRDPINPYLGGLVTIFGFASRGEVLSSVASAEAFARRNGVASAPVQARLPPASPGDPTSVETLTWTSDGKPVCRLYTIIGGGHVVPQPAFRFRRLFGTTSSFNAPREAWSFFEAT